MNQPLARASLPALLIAALACSDPEPATEHYRPAYHFTPARNWINDPNGLVYYKGEYHLFFQHNPTGTLWGHMSWGHAVSRDLVHWTELPVAMPERWNMTIYSGSAVVDWRNSSGLGSAGEPPLIAAYTGHQRLRHIERQYIAFSVDRGRTWQQYDGNPVLDEDNRDFRDPKVFWHEESKRWVMAICFAVYRDVAIYTSPDLLTWTRRSTLKPKELPDGQLEVPELMRLPVEGGGSRWVLTYFFKAASLDSGSGGRYYVGDFDGETFTPDPAAQPSGSAIIDYGGDFYAAQSWSDLPTADGRTIWLAWMANVAYAHLTPTHPWRGALSIPRVLSLHVQGGVHQLRQRPIAELEALRSNKVQAAELTLGQAPVALPLPSEQAGAIELQATLAVDANAKARLALRYGAEALVIEYDAASQQLAIDRTRAGILVSPPATNRRTAPVALDGGRLGLRVFVDRSSVEVFAQDGERVLTYLVFPTAPLSGIEASAEGGAAAVASYEAYRLAEMRRDGAGR